MNSEECSELDTAYGAMMLFNNGYAVMMDTSSMMDNTIQVTIQPSTAILQSLQSIITFHPLLR